MKRSEAVGRRTVSVSLPGDRIAAIVDAAARAGESVSGFLAEAGAQRARKVLREKPAPNRHAA